ncbi:hypothetical protein MTP99_005793 [Tenebrio molitor]|jgi:hypothetical protein|nr:hypothetical protein MTP99_005793 [Tenebrio molitor]
MNTAAEYAEMLILYGEYGAMHVRMQENMRFPNYNVFLRLVNRARDTGSLVHTYMTRNWWSPAAPREARPPQTEDAVLQSFDDDGSRSIFEELYLPQTYQYFRRTE